MTSASERSYTRRDTVMFLACLGLSLVALFSPDRLGQAVSQGLRGSVLAPLVWLQARAEEGRTGRARLRAITVQRDSAAYLAQGIPSLLAENERLRAGCESCPVNVQGQMWIDVLEARVAALEEIGHKLQGELGVKGELLHQAHSRIEALEEALRDCDHELERDQVGRRDVLATGLVGHIFLRFRDRVAALARPTPTPEGEQG